jgi:hypothetical protein
VGIRGPHLALEQVEEEEQLLREWEHKGAQGGDVSLQGVTGNGHQVLGQVHAHLQAMIRCLPDLAPVRKAALDSGRNALYACMSWAAVVNPRSGTHSWPFNT